MHEKKVQFPEASFVPLTWPPFHCFLFKFVLFKFSKFGHSYISTCYPDKISFHFCLKCFGIYHISDRRTLQLFSLTAIKNKLNRTQPHTQRLHVLPPYRPSPTPFQTLTYCLYTTFHQPLRESSRQPTFFLRQQVYRPTHRP